MNKCVLYYCYWVSTQLQLTNVTIQNILDTKSAIQFALLVPFCTVGSHAATCVVALDQSPSSGHLAVNFSLVYTCGFQVRHGFFTVAKPRRGIT